jgi:hypothetical protein
MSATIRSWDGKGAPALILSSLCQKDRRWDRRATKRCERLRLDGRSIYSISFSASGAKADGPSAVGGGSDEGSEWLIRLIGPDCFAEIDKQGHADAVEELEKREARERDSVFLVSQRDQHRLALKVLIAARRVADALDAFGADLRRRLYVTLNVNLWQHVRTGELRVSREIADLRTPGKTLYLEQRFGSLSGHKLLDPNIKKLEPKFAPHVDFLEEILFITDDAWSEKIGQLGSQEVRQTAKKLGATLDAARDFRVEVTDLRAFLAPENLGTLRSWGSSNTEGSPIGVFARRDGATLRVGSSETRNMLVQIPLDLDLEIPSVAGPTAKRP